MKDQDQLFRFARSQGWIITTTKNGHYQLVSPSGQAVTCPGTPSDWRSFQNTIADLRRYGLEVPRKSTKKKEPEPAFVRRIVHDLGLNCEFIKFPHIDSIMGQWRDTTWFDRFGMPISEDEWGLVADEDLCATIILSPATISAERGGLDIMGVNTAAIQRPADRTLHIHILVHKYWDTTDTSPDIRKCACGKTFMQPYSLAEHVVHEQERGRIEHAPVGLAEWTDPEELRIIMGAEDQDRIERLERDLETARTERREAEKELEALKARVKAVLG